MIIICEQELTKSLIILQEENESREGKRRMMNKNQKLELTWIGKDDEL
jgi:hypothetical protein